VTITTSFWRLVAAVLRQQGRRDPGWRAQSGMTLSVLVFSRTAGFRHGRIAAGFGAICAMGERRA
jgi:hypothetical protein